MILDELEAADVILKLGGGIGSSSHYSSNSSVVDLVQRFQTELIGVACALPHEDPVVELKDMMSLTAEVARGLLEARVRFCSIPMLDLLRSCARKTPAGALERRMSNTNRKEDARRASGARRLIKSVPTEMAQRFGDAYCHADVLDHVLRSGQAELEKAQFVEVPRHAYVRINLALNALALPIFFDPQRLLAGATMAADLAEPGSFEMDFLMPLVLTKKDTMVSSARTRKAAAFLIVASRMGADAYGSEVSMDDLVEKIGQELYTCRHVSEQHSYTPPRVNRLVTGLVADFAERLQFSTDECLALRLALAVPCLHMSEDLKVEVDYDGGLLSVWDSVRILSGARAYQKKPAVPLPLLLSSVLSGLLFSLVAPGRRGGPFVVSEAILRKVEDVECSWPKWPYDLSEASERRRRTSIAFNLAKQGKVEAGKFIGASASACLVIQGGPLKKARPRTEACEARYGESIGMMSAVYSFERELARCGHESAVEMARPMDGSVALKRVYVAQIGTLPSVIAYLRDRPELGSPLFEDSSMSCVENTWRELIGGSMFLFTMRKVTEEAFRRTLREDWKILPSVQRVLKMREEDPNVRVHGEGVMTGNAAMQLLADRALESAQWVFNEDNIRDSDPEAKEKRRVLRQQHALAKTAYRIGCCGPLWECMITHLITTHNFGKAGKRKAERKLQGGKRGRKG